MHRSLQHIRNILVRSLEIVLVVAFIVLTLDVLWGVFSRYVLGSQSRWTEELAIYLLIWVSLLGAAVTFEENGHLGVDYFVGKLDPAAQKWAAIFVEFVVLAFAVICLIYGGGVLVARTLEAGQISPALGWKVGYIYTVVPISGVFFVLFGLEHLIELFTGKHPAHKGHELYGLED